MNETLARHEFDFARYDETHWASLRDERFPSAGSWVQEKGFIVPHTREGVAEEDLFRVGDAGCFAMRTLKNVRMSDGRLEMDVALIDRAAPYLCFRVQPGTGDTHGSLYALVVYNQVRDTAGEQGVNLWKFLASEDGQHAARWRKLAWWNVPVDRERRLRLAVAFRKERMRVYLDGRQLGDAADYDTLGPGAVGFAAIEGIARFYRFTVEAYAS